MSVVSWLVGFAHSVTTRYEILGKKQQVTMDPYYPHRLARARQAPRRTHCSRDRWGSSSTDWSLTQTCWRWVRHRTHRVVSRYGQAGWRCCIEPSAWRLRMRLPSVEGWHSVTLDMRHLAVWVWGWFWDILTFTLEGYWGYSPGFVRLTSGCDICIPAIGVGVLKLLPVLLALETGNK